MVEYMFDILMSGSGGIKLVGDFTSVKGIYKDYCEMPAINIQHSVGTLG